MAGEVEEYLALRRAHRRAMAALREKEEGWIGPLAEHLEELSDALHEARKEVLAAAGRGEVTAEELSDVLYGGEE